MDAAVNKSKKPTVVGLSVAKRTGSGQQAMAL
jgi:hypothetical protein